MPAVGRRRRARDLALGLHHPGEAGRRDPERQRHPRAQHLARGVDGRDVAQDRRHELDVRERLPGPGQRHLAVGGAVGVVERGLRRTPLGDRAQVVDGQRLVEPPGLGRHLGLLELQQRSQVVRLRHLSLHRRAPVGSWRTGGWVRATSARRSSRLARHGAERAGLDEHVAEGGRLDGAGEHRQAEPVGEQPAEQGVLGAAADDVHAAYAAARQRRGLVDRVRERLGEAAHDAEDGGDPAVRGLDAVLAAPVRDPGGHVAGRQEPRVLHVEERDRAAVRRRRLQPRREVVVAPAAQGLREQPGAHHVGEEAGPPVDPALVGEVGRAGLVGEHRPVQLDADQAPGAAGDVRRVGVGHRHADDRRGGVVGADGHDRGAARACR